MEAEGEAGNVGLKSRAQTGTEANKSGSETNQILLWTIASWGHYRDGISLWRLPIKNKLEELPTHCQWRNSSSASGKNYNSDKYILESNSFKVETMKPLWCIKLLITVYIVWSIVEQKAFVEKQEENKIFLNTRCYQKASKGKISVLEAVLWKKNKLIGLLCMYLITTQSFVLLLSDL